MITTSSRAVLRLTVVDPDRTASADLLVDLPVDTPFAEVRATLDAGAGGVAGQRFRTDAGPVADDAVVGRPPLVDGAVLVVDRAQAAVGGRGGPPPLVEVHVVGGLRAGDRVGLPLGRHVVGRGPDCDVRLDDPDVSRAHALVEVGPDAVRVTDLGSANGTALVTATGHAPVHGSPAPWPRGAALLVGGSRLVVRSVGADAADPSGADGPASTVPDGRGHLLVNRAPRLRQIRPPVVVAWPETPRETPPSRLPWAAVALPAVIAVPMALLTRQPSFLLLGLLSPLALLGQHLLERRSGRRATRQAWADHATAVVQARESLAAATIEDLALLEQEHPDPARLAAAAAGPSVLLWHRSNRDDDAWRVRLGRGAVPVRVAVTAGRDGAGPGRPDDLPDHAPGRHQDAPIAVDLGSTPVLGIAGPREAVLSVGRMLLGQVAVLRPPSEVTVQVRTVDDGPGAGWDWATWLPHNGSDATGRHDGGGLDGGGLDDGGLDDRASTGRAPRSGAGGTERFVLLDGAQDLRRRTDVAELLARARASGERIPGSDTRAPRTVVVCLDEEPSRLPAECDAVLVLDALGRGVLRSSDATADLVADGVGPALAARLGRDLARLRDATPSSRHTDDDGTIRLPDLLGLSEPARSGDATGDVEAAAAGDGVADAWAGAIAARWAGCAGPPRLRVVLGTSNGGPWQVDLRHDGPHALVAGTTGAGKSELLRSLVAGLAVEHPPTQVTMLLVDYKGGTAFAGLDRLPHVCGLLTDLDQHLARRALTSLHAELRRRERLLRRHGVGDLDGYDRLPGAGREPVPRLLLVVDEFRTLADELPDLLAGLVRVAALGRSLGVHLVLATQRPAGAVTADMRANLNLRVALRVRDRADSEDVVEAPDAASLTPDRPGHAFARSGGGPLVPVRVALLEDPPVDDGRPRVTTLRAGGAARSVQPGRHPTQVDDAGPTGAPGRRAAVDRLVDACRRVVGSGATPLPAPPWLPPLPEVVAVDDVDRLCGGTSPRAAVAIPGISTGSTRPATSVLLGLVDRPDEQRREALCWDLTAGHLAVVGGPGSGRSSALRTAVAGSLNAGAHVHVLTGAADLGVPPDAPGVGTLVPVSDPDRAARLLRHLARERVPGRWTVLVVDGWEAVAEALGGHDRGRPLDDLVAVVRDRGADGVRLVAAGGRTLLTGQVGALLSQRLLLRTPDPTDLLVAGVAPDEVPSSMPPGRCLVLAGGGRRPVEAQLALLDTDPSPDAQMAALGRAALRRAALRRAALGRAALGRAEGHEAGSGADGPPPLRLRPLPDRVLLDDLAAVERHDSAAPARSVLIGVGGDAAEPLALPLPPGGVVLVAGNPRSGRSTALAVVERRARALGLQVLRPEHLQDHVRSAPATEGGKGGVAAAAPQGCLILLDDVDRVGPEVRAAAESLVAAGATAVVAAGPAEAAVAYSGLLAATRSTGCGLLLGLLGPGDGEVLGVRSVASPRSLPAGRGLLVVRGEAVPVQVADPSDGMPVDHASGTPDGIGPSRSRERTPTPRADPPGRRTAAVDDTVGPTRS